MTLRGRSLRAPLGALCLLLAGCAATQERATPSEPPPGISFRVTDGDIAGADQRARSYCSQHDETAVRTGVHDAPEGKARIAVYECRKRE